MTHDTRKKKLFDNYSVWVLLIDLYIISGVLYFVLRLTVGFSWWGVELASEGLHIFLPFSVLALIMVIMWRLWLRIGGAAVMVLAFLILFGPQMARGMLGVERVCDDCLTVMSYNIGTGIAPADELHAYLGSSGADLIGLQEVAERDMDALRGLEAYPYQAFYPNGMGFGRALLSRHPIVSDDLVAIYGEDNPTYLIATVDVEGFLATVIVTRFKTPRFGWYTTQYGFKTWPNAAPLASELKAREGSTTVMMVDMNASVYSRNMAMLQEVGYTDVHQRGGGGFGLTFPSRTDAWRELPSWFPAVVRIDHILVTDDVAVLGAWVDRSVRLSDHYPVFANIRLPR